MDQAFKFCEACGVTSDKCSAECREYWNVPHQPDEECGKVIIFPGGGKEPGTYCGKLVGHEDDCCEEPIKVQRHV